MKKVALTLASIAAITAFAPEASALPVFARQTGMACSACHFQHFPLLNGFGRSFKANAFTMIGSQGVVEGEGLSIPDRLNLAGLTSVWAGTQSGDATQPQVGVPGSGGELSIFYGGKVSDNAGFLSELAATGTAGAAQTGGAKLVVLYPVADMRAGLSAFTTGGQGAAYGLEYLNTGAVDAHKMTDNGQIKQHLNAAYANTYMGAHGNATGAAVIVDGNWGMASATTWAPAGPGTNAGTQALTLNYGRAVATFDLAGFDSAVGVQTYGGTYCGATPVVCTDYKVNVVDGQLQGEVAGLATGFYVSYASAPAGTNGKANAFAAGNSTLGGGLANLSATSLNVAASVEVAKAATVHAGARFATLTDANGATSGIAGSDNAVMIGATYELAMNLSLGVDYTTQSGSAWDAYRNGAGAGVDKAGKTAATISLYALF